MTDERHEDGGEMAVYDTPYTPRQVSLVEEWRQVSSSILTSIDTETDDGKARYMQCLTGSTDQLQFSIKDPFVVVDWLLHVVNRQDDETGEVSQGLRLAMTCEDGRVISTGSAIFIDNWAHLFRMYGHVKPWPKMQIKVKAVKAKKMGYYLTLEWFKVVTPATSQARKPK